MAPSDCVSSADTVGLAPPADGVDAADSRQTKTPTDSVSNTSLRHATVRSTASSTDSALFSASASSKVGSWLLADTPRSVTVNALDPRRPSHRQFVLGGRWGPSDPSASGPASWVLAWPPTHFGAVRTTGALCSYVLQHEQSLMIVRGVLRRIRACLICEVTRPDTRGTMQSAAGRRPVPRYRRFVIVSAMLLRPEHDGHAVTSPSSPNTVANRTET